MYLFLKGDVMSVVKTNALFIYTYVKDKTDIW
jgi:hypothetical protein